jgi:hypothetical protein
MTDFLFLLCVSLMSSDILLISLAQQYPSLYDIDIVRRANALVADVLTGNPINIEFRRTLSTNKWKASLAAFTKPSHLRESDRDS